MPAGQQHNVRKRGSNRKHPHTNSNNHNKGNNGSMIHPKNRLIPIVSICLTSAAILVGALVILLFRQRARNPDDAFDDLSLGIAKVKSTPKQVLVYKNGERQGGVVVMLTQGTCRRLGEKDLAYMLAEFLYRGEHNPCQQVKDDSGGGGRPSQANAGCRAFDHVGRRVKDCEAAGHLVPSAMGRLLYLVPPGREFLWPTIEVGHKEVISHIIPPTGSPIVVETLSHSPRLFKLHGFFSDQEADSIVAHVQDGSSNPYTLSRSTESFQGEETLDLKKTSDSGFDINSKASADLKRRAFKLLGIERYDETWADGLQVLRYNKSAAYNRHLDYIDRVIDPNHNFDSSGGGTNRFATILFYLSDVKEGGETYFSEVFGSKGPPSPGEIQQLWQHVRKNQERWGIANDSWEEKMLLHCMTKMIVKPKKGDAILFYSQLANGSVDPMSMHGGCPVLSGDKWAANLWVWNGPRLGYTDSDANRELASKVRQKSYQIEHG